MLPRQPDENPSTETACQRKRGQQQPQHTRPLIWQNPVPPNECTHGEANNRCGNCAADLRYTRFLDPRSAYSRSVDCRSTPKASPMEILQYASTGRQALKNTDHQNAMAALPPESHANSY